MSSKKAILTASAALTLLAAAPAAGQAPPAASAPPSNPYRGLWTGWNAAIDDSRDAEAQAQAQAQTQAGRTAAPATSVPASSTLVPARSREEAEALGARVGEIVRNGDCEEGERIARAAGDFPLVQAVRAYCRSGDPAR